MTCSLQAQVSLVSDALDELVKARLQERATLGDTVSTLKNGLALIDSLRSKLQTEQQKSLALESERTALQAELQQVRNDGLHAVKRLSEAVGCADHVHLPSLSKLVTAAVEKLQRPASLSMPEQVALLVKEAQDLQSTVASLRAAAAAVVAYYTPPFQMTGLGFYEAADGKVWRCAFVGNGAWLCYRDLDVCAWFSADGSVAHSHTHLYPELVKYLGPEAR